jgi:CheY-like chemotaxis protein
MFGRSPRTIQKLLIVEDEPLIAFDNEHFLIDCGYTIVGTLDNAPAALAAIQAGGIDLILSDVRLSRGTSGRDVAIAAQAAAIPLLFVTASCPVDAPAIAIGCLTKPYRQRDLKRAIDAIELKLAGGAVKRVPKGLSLY